MSKFKLHIISVVLAAASYSAHVAAQVHQPNSFSSRPNPSGQVSTGDRSEPGTASVRRRMSSDDAPVLTAAIRVNPIEMVPLRGRPYAATSGEGRIHYFYEDDRLVQEQIGDSDDETIVGDYVYDGHGRLERIEYDDGIIISAKYGSYGQLDSLASNQGRTIGFGYYANQNGAIRAVTPTQNFLEFHSGVALLRLKYRPAWWPAPMERAVKKIEDGPAPEPVPGDGRPSESPYPGIPPYPGNPLPEYPTTPDGTPIITISAPLLPPMPSPPPSYTEGVQIVPVGEPRNLPPPKGGSPGIIGNELKELHSFDTMLELIKQCQAECGRRSRNINADCRTGPTLEDKDDCWNKLQEWEYHCDVGCKQGDYHQTFEQSMPSHKLNFAPWKTIRKKRI